MIEVVFCRYCQKYYLVDKCSMRPNGTHKELVCPKNCPPEGLERNNAICEVLDLLRAIMEKD